MQLPIVVYRSTATAKRLNGDWFQHYGGGCVHRLLPRWQWGANRLFWNGGKCYGSALENKVDHAVPIRSRTEDLEPYVKIDPDRVYLTGFSKRPDMGSVKRRMRGAYDMRLVDNQFNQLIEQNRINKFTSKLCRNL